MLLELIVCVAVPAGEAVSWVQCDSCDLWFHLLCVGLGKDEIKEDEDYVCFNCTNHTSDSNTTPTSDGIKIKQEPQDDGFRTSADLSGINSDLAALKSATADMEREVELRKKAEEEEDVSVEAEDSIVNVTVGDGGMEEEEEEEAHDDGQEKREADSGVELLMGEEAGGEEEEVEMEDSEEEEEEMEEEEVVDVATGDGGQHGEEGSKVKVSKPAAAASAASLSTTDCAALASSMKDSPGLEKSQQSSEVVTSWHSAHLWALAVSLHLPQAFHLCPGLASVSQRHFL